MGYLLIGFIFILFNFWIPIGIVNIGVLPEFVGWILICKGIKEFNVCKENFGIDTLKLCVSIAAIISGIIYIINLTGMTAAIENIWNLRLWINFFEFARIVFSSFIIFTLIRLVLKETEETMEINLYTYELKTAYIIILICKIIMCAVGFVEELYFVGIMAFVCVIIVNIVFCILMYRGKRSYISKDSE